jgi:ribosomal-protein-serine acetyltransferase
LLIPATLPLTEAAHLRRLRHHDGPAIEALVRANLEHLRPWMPWAEDGYDAGWIDAAVQEMERSLSANFVFVEGGAVLGTIGFHAFDRGNRATSIGYWIAAPAQSRGLVTLAVRALCGLAFETWGIHRVQLRAAPGNARSRAVAERCGFLEEGIARGAELIDGRFRDLVVYSLLAPDF